MGWVGVSVHPSSALGTRLSAADEEQAFKGTYTEGGREGVNEGGREGGSNDEHCLHYSVLHGP